MIRQLNCHQSLAQQTLPHLELVTRLVVASPRIAFWCWASSTQHVQPVRFVCVTPHVWCETKHATPCCYVCQLFVLRSSAYTYRSMSGFSNNGLGLL